MTAAVVDMRADLDRGQLDELLAAAAWLLNINRFALIESAGCIDQRRVVWWALKDVTTVDNGCLADMFGCSVAVVVCGLSAVEGNPVWRGEAVVLVERLAVEVQRIEGQ